MHVYALLPELVFRDGALKVDLGCGRQELEAVEGSAVPIVHLVSVRCNYLCFGRLSQVRAGTLENPPHPP